MARKSKIGPYLHLLGMVPDQQIARMAKLAQPASVQAQRKKLKINSFRENFIKIEKSLKTMKKTVSDEDAAKNISVPVQLLTAVRHFEEIVKSPKAASKKYKIDKNVLQAMLEKSTHKKSGRKKKTDSNTKIVQEAKVAEKSPKKETKRNTKKTSKSKKSTAKSTAKSKKNDAPKRTYTKRKVEPKAVFIQAFECSFRSGETSMSIFVNASSFQEAASKVEAIQSDKSIKGTLSTIRSIGVAVQ
ncbi:MAG: hypothetical protein CL916_08840 [Deltaproteobacteria bacterium]|nr:hypothetical protein [Deltaproteobacteria bacterium]